MLWLDALTRASTAFPNFADMRQCLENGYVPTLLQNTRRKRLLAKVVCSLGYRVWTGSN